MVTEAKKSSDTHAVDGDVTASVRRANRVVLGLVLLAVVFGAEQGIASSAGVRDALMRGLMTTEVVLGFTLVLLGSLVEGFGFGLSLGTQWPYTRNIFVLMWRGDPEAAHRLVATAVGLIALALVVVHADAMTITGLVLVIVTALFGMGTLYVLAGRAPAFVHGAHGFLAYLVLLNYALGLAYPAASLLPYIKGTIALHPLLLAVFLGGMVTGGRGFMTPIAAFYRPTRSVHWILVAHILAALLVIGTLGWLMPLYPVAFYLSVAQVAVGFFLFHAVNLRPKAPGAVVAFHQTMVLLMTAAIIWQWR
ncbi:MAG: cytochrome C oxidase assembly protein [Acidiferrobacter sp.]